MFIADTLIKRVVLGTVLIILGLKIRQIDAGSAELIETSCTNKDSFCEIYKFGFTTLGLGGVWSLLIIIGIFYLVIYDWLAGYVREIAKELAKTASDIHGLANDQIKKHRFNKAELKLFLISIFGNSAGDNEPEGESLGGFVADLLLYFRPGRVWRGQHSTTISISEIPVNSLSSKYFRWHQRTTYTMKGANKHVKSSIRLHTSVDCSAAELQVVLDNLQYSIQAGPSRVDFKTSYNATRLAEIGAGKTVLFDRFAVTYQNGVVRVSIEVEIDVPESETGIIIDEDSIIGKDDREYVHTITEPTRGLFLRFEVPSGHKVSGCHASPAGYQNRTARNSSHPAITKIGNDGRSAEIMSSSWVLPGISSVVIWR